MRQADGGCLLASNLRLNAERTDIEGRGSLTALPLFGFAEKRRFGQGEQDDFFAGYGANVMVKTYHVDTRGVFDERFHDRPRCFD